MTTHVLHAAALTGPTVNLIDDVRRMLALHFMVNAFRAGAVAAVLGAVIGWFMVLRRQSFVGHTLAVVSFPGAAAAIWLGVSATAGYFAGSIAAALVIALVPRTPIGRAGGQESAVIGTVQAFALASGALFISLYGGFLDSVTGLLFGSFLGVSDGQVVVLVVVAAVVLLVMVVLARPLFFATVDSDVAAARGVPERALSVVFLIVLGCTAAEVSQITGALLVFALLVMPAAAAQQLTARPMLGLGLSVALGLFVVWSALGVAFYSTWPVGFFVSTFGFATYLAAVGIRLAGSHPVRKVSAGGTSPIPAVATA
jgi:zinc/manganese transport system permease protein